LSVNALFLAVKVAKGQIKKVPQNIDFVGLVFLLSPFGFSFGDPLGARTQDPNIKSVVLYLLS
jgi:hypothetical protein